MKNVNGVMARAYAKYRKAGKSPEVAIKWAIQDRKWTIEGLTSNENF